MINKNMINQEIGTEEQLNTSKKLIDSLDYIDDNLTVAFNEVDLTKINNEFNQLEKLANKLFNSSYITNRIHNTKESIQSSFNLAKYFYDEVKDQRKGYGLFKDDRQDMRATFKDLYRFVFMYTDRCGVLVME